MRIKSIHIENYRQYKGPIDIEFSLDDKKNFTIIEGTNGAGKTNLLNAITWCLYEKELHKSSKPSTGDVIYNSITEKETAPGDSFNVLVELVLVDKYGINTTFTRSVLFSCNNKGKLSRSPYSNFVVKNDLMDSDEEMERPNLFIDQELPEDIEGYFFFDGEKLEDYFDENSENSIKKSVYRLSQLNLIDSALSNLDISKKYYSKQISKLDKSLGKKLEDQSVLEASLRKYKKQKNDAISKNEKLKTKLEDLRNQLKEIDKGNIKDLENERERLEKNKKLLVKNINSEIKDKRKLIIKNFPLVYGYSSMKDAQELCKNKGNKEDETQLYYDPDLLEHILNEDKCLCGCDLSKDKHAREIVENLVKNANNSYIYSEIKDALRNINVSMMEIEDVNDKIKEHSLNIESYEKDLAEITEEIEFNKYKREGIDESSIRNLNIQISDAEKEKDNLISDIAIADQKIKEIKNKLEKIDIERRNQKIKNATVRKLQKYESFCSQAISNMELLKSKILKEIRLKVEKETTEQFLKLMWKDNFEKVIINNNYDVKLQDVFGNIVSPGKLSAGEKLVLALSFVSALNNISGFDLPIIIDTPMGRLGSEMSNNIAITLPKYVDGKQVTLLVTDKEYDDDFREGILENVWKEYKIQYSRADVGEESRIVLNDR